ncbi:squalene-associated FAD-dependent desaturase [Ectothiorhodosinus mongolicus]|uniref:Squalene-associated FAD-dependent desaturase n=1 Tax=Ectothiorhodosinus mongolicus TaxID=233100 RepID=A0A1R3W7J8_9GAMM|nr:hydroxysqualene dehydroxylase HpnE [Ectothiorhodosinus mongolicus]ULX58029.1 amine oxidase [Ectothiorhodosinus mongolicus]SIT73150.1 squalene-associated FAD-dependent desaturase [Ectothiorhodosinus mongolicus]
MTAPIAIIGTGWAGLAAAITLVRAGAPVELFEAAPQPGGRARRARLEGLNLDNGQHLLMGAYTTTLELLRHIEVKEPEVLRRAPLDLVSLRGDGSRLSLSSAYLPAPWHLLAALMTARGLSWREKSQALPGMRRMLQTPPDAQHSVLQWLEDLQQPPRLIQELWIPLCLAVMNTHAEIASARVFFNVLQGAFTGHRSHSDLLVPRADLGSVFPEPAASWLARQGCPLHHNQRVISIGPQAEGMHIQLRQRQSLMAQAVIMATGHAESARLLPDVPSLQPLRDNLASLGTEPICTVYLRYPRQVRLPMPMQGLLGGIGQWVFDRRFSGHPGVMAVVISGNGSHLALDNEALATAVDQELRQHYPQWPAPLWQRVVREKQATFCASVASEALRPGNHTALPGLWLAGDYTDTGLPATLEGAVRSGVECARQILSSA